MKKRILFAGLLLLLTLSTFAATPVTSGKTNAQKIVEAIHNPKTDYVVVVSHRGDWRDYPENSIPAIESIIRMGVDVMELDLKPTVYLSSATTVPLTGLLQEKAESAT